MIKKLLLISSLLLTASAAPTAMALPIADQGSWQTTLHARDAQGRAVALDSSAAVFFYDSLLDVTWLRQASSELLEGWAQAKAWADGLEVGGHSDWRLPQTLDTGLPGCARVTYNGGDCGYNVPTQVGDAFSEMAHLFHVTLGNQAAYTTGGQFRGWDSQGSEWGLVNTAGFEGLQATQYWSGSTISVAANYAWAFHLDLGYQSMAEKGLLQGARALALRDGDVLVSSVPEPSTALLAGAGLLVLLSRRLRRD